MSKTKIKKSHPFLVKNKQTAEEREWIVYEEGYDEGYESGVVDFAEVEKRKAQLRAKGLKVIGD